MKFIGGFFQFARRVLEAAKKGGLAAVDLKKLDNLLQRTGKRNAVLAKGILSALSAGGAPESDIQKFGELLKKAEKRIEEDQNPFTVKEQEEIALIFKRAYVSDKAQRWFTVQLDELLAGEIKEFVEGTRRVEIPIPKKKSVSFQNDKKKLKA
ncbi:hypothetical protein JXA56_05030 [Candidatus Micrarchaeota archaeon]|nr:hypothetical protein [Candidatus Micrarchaeota archaeon]